MPDNLNVIAPDPAVPAPKKPDTTPEAEDAEESTTGEMLEEAEKVAPDVKMDKSAFWQGFSEVCLLNSINPVALVKESQKRRAVSKEV